MTTKCTGLMGRIFGHKFIAVMKPDSSWVSYRRMNMRSLKVGLSKGIDYCICQRCGAVTREKK